ncbi:MAG: GntP family permease [Acidobacteriota bacterium]|nr:GntP family permease [Acidobacteriota bacterium]
MAFIVCIAALCFLMFVAYRGFSVILFAPVAALLAVLLTQPKAVLPVYSGLFMAKMVVFVQNYFPAFMLGAIFGKVIELSGFAKAIVHAVVKLLGPSRAMLSIVTVCALLTYGGVSLFVVVFAVYPFAVELFRELNIPKRLIPGTIAMGAFTFTMDSLPGTPQIQNIIPTTFFKTNAYAAPILGTIGAVFILAIGMTYLEWQRRKAQKAGEGYGTGHINEPEPIDMSDLPNPYISILPLLVVGIMNVVFTRKIIPAFYGDAYSFQLSSGMHDPIAVKVPGMVGIWAVEAALVLGILTVVVFGWKRIGNKFADGTKSAIGGALLASMNTASEYGFGSVISALPGFVLVSGALSKIPNPLIKEALSVNILAGITGSASGGMGIALAAMSQQFIDAANAAHIPMEVLHRVAAMASGGMDTLPHNGAVITLLAVTGLTHKQSYKDIFAVTCIKTTAVFFIIAVFYLTHLV